MTFRFPPDPSEPYTNSGGYSSFETTCPQGFFGKMCKSAVIGRAKGYAELLPIPFLRTVMACRTKASLLLNPAYCSNVVSSTWYVVCVPGTVCSVAVLYVELRSTVWLYMALWLYVFNQVTEEPHKHKWLVYLHRSMPREKCLFGN